MQFPGKMGDMIRQVKKAQEMVQRQQEELAKVRIEASAGGGMVKVTITGGGIVKKIFIDDSLVNKDEKEILEDLLIAALNDAKKKSDDGSSDALRSATSGIPLPAGFKF